MNYLSSTVHGGAGYADNSLSSIIFKANQLAQSESKAGQHFDPISVVMKATDNFLIRSKLLADPSLIEDNLTDQLTSFGYTIDNLNIKSDVNATGLEGVRSLVADARIPLKYQEQAMLAVASLIDRYRASGGSSRTLLNSHYASARSLAGNLMSEGDISNGMALTSPSLSYMMENIVPSNEAFGADIDKVLPELKASISVTLMEFHNGVVDRLMNRRNITIPHVQYVVPHSNVYDNLLSNSSDASVRVHGAHVVPTIELYHNPVPVSANAVPIVPKIDKARNGELHADGVIKFSKNANLLDLSLEEGKMGYGSVNRTDLISENVSIQSILLKLQKEGSADEYISVPTTGFKKNRLLLQPNANDSGDRGCVANFTFKLSSTTKTVSEQPSAILAPCTATDRIRVRFHGGFSISIKYGDAVASGGVNFMPYNIGGADVPVDNAVVDLASKITITPVGYTLDARFSEENLRKSQIALEAHIRTFDFEIYNGRNFLIDHSIVGQNVPEYLMSLTAEVTSIGQDHRALEIITKQLVHTYDRNAEERKDPNLRDLRDRQGFESIAGQLTKPLVLMRKIDISEVENIRSGDFFGDVRGFIEWELLNMYAVYYQRSLYKQQLKGHKPVFKCLTSPIILDTLMTAPHYHNHLNTDTPSNGNDVEYTRVLANGTVLEMASSCVDYMYNKLIAIPYREDNPESVISFGQHWDCGTIVAHYSPQHDNGVSKRIFSNTRAQAITTNPSGMYCEFEGMHLLVENNRAVGEIADLLASPSDIIDEIESTL